MEKNEHLAFIWSQFFSIHNKFWATNNGQNYESGPKLIIIPVSVYVVLTVL